jgi:proteic killer suppression protein
MIKSFANKATAQLFGGICPRQWRSVRKSAERKLALLEAATSLEFLRAPPGNRLELLKGDRKGQNSIRINDQWRVCFTWKDGDAFDVAIVDYH